MLPIRVLVPDTTAFPSFTFSHCHRHYSRHRHRRIATCASCWPDLKKVPSLRPSPAIASVTSTWVACAMIIEGFFIWSFFEHCLDWLLWLLHYYIKWLIDNDHHHHGHQSLWGNPVSQLDCLRTGVHPVHYQAKPGSRCFRRNGMLQRFWSKSSIYHLLWTMMTIVKMVIMMTLMMSDDQSLSSLRRSPSNPGSRWWKGSIALNRWVTLGIMIITVMTQIMMMFTPS